ncbi:MAG TPA: septation protein A [Rhizomicrobium sp.]|jgi:intracellular septation protein
MTAPSKPSMLLKFALDLGPLIIFFGVFEKFGIYAATGAFMVAVIAALAFGYIRERKLSPIPLFTAVLVIVFGGLTIYLHNDTFIKVKLTVLYGIFGAVLLGGLWFNHLFIKYIFAETFDLTERGWRTLTVRWGVFFFALAGLNEFVWRHYPTATWVLFKVWVVTPLIFLFALAQTPLVLKHQVEENKTGADS